MKHLKIPTPKKRVFVFIALPLPYGVLKWIIWKYLLLWKECLFLLHYHFLMEDLGESFENTHSYEKSVCFYCITTSIWGTQVNHLKIPTPMKRVFCFYCITTSLWMTQVNLLAQDYRYHKLWKTFGKFFSSYSELLSKIGAISFQEYVSKGITHPVFYGDLDYKLRRDKCEANFISSGSKIVKCLHVVGMIQRSSRGL